MFQLRTILALFFLSGSCALIYEILWARMLGLVFGNTVFAISTVLAVFMGGLALGSWLASRWADRPGFPLKRYALVEIAIGLYAFLVPQLFQLLESFYILIYRNLHPDFYQLSLIRFLCSVAILILPTTLMGTTLPFMIRYLVRAREKIGEGAGWLYFANTLGAVAGSFFCGFFLIRWLGVRDSNYLAAFGNILIGLLALRLNQRAPYRIAQPEREMKAEGLAGETRRGRLVFYTLALSGFCALALEVFWSRILSILIGNTTYAFASMLSTYLMGIAAGSLFSTRALVQRRRGLLIFALLEFAIGLSAISMLLGLQHWETISEIMGARLGRGGWWRLFGRSYLYAVLVMFLPTFLSGAVFPIAVKLYAPGLNQLSGRVGRLYAGNTVGAILGSLFAGFIMIPLFGVIGGICLTAALSLGIGLVLLYSVAELGVVRKARWALSWGLGFIVVLCFVPVYTPVTKYTGTIWRPGDQLLFYREGTDDTTVVLKGSDGVKRLYVNHNEAAEDSLWDIPSHTVIAHIPLLLHPNPQRALVIGFGMGVTTRSILGHGVSVDAVEISRGVVEANHLFWPVNGRVLEHEGVELFVEDGRNRALLTSKKYDMVSVGIIHPLVSSGSAGFYSRDFYRLCDSVLSERGVMSQWVPLHFIEPDKLKIIVRTFIEVFPHSSVWLKFNNNFLLLVGQKNPVGIEWGDIVERCETEAVRESLALTGINNAYSLFDSFLMQGEDILRYVGEGVVHTDDHPWIEFAGAMGGGQTIALNLHELMQHRSPVYSFTQITGISDAQQAKFQKYYQATELALQALVLNAVGNYQEQGKLLTKAEGLNPDDGVIEFLYWQMEERMLPELLSEVETLLKRRDLRGAIALYQQAVPYLRDFPIVENNLGVLYEEVGEYERAREHYERAIERDPDLWEARLNLGKLLKEQYRELDKAEKQLRRVLELQPGQVDALRLLGELEGSPEGE